MNAPTLLIGLGGTGCKIIERVSKMATPEQLRQIAFVAFDTDINELNDIQERNPFVKIIQTSTQQTVGQYLNKDTHARDTWFPVNAILNGKTLTEGAGQVRSVSRLAFETVIRAGRMEPLHEAIYSLFKVEDDKADQALRVVIVSSLAGGTGSGLILPVALYLRNYLETHFRQKANITRGFFILPEVFYEVIPGQAERNNLKSNAYATLRELDAFLMKGDNTLHEKYNDSVRMHFPKVASDGYEEYKVRPYDFCFLFDAQNAKGDKLNSFDQYLEHAANCIYAQSIGPMNKRSNSSEDNVIRKLAKERGRNRYAGAGASMLIYPFEDIRNFIALNWTKQCVSNRWLTYDNLYKEMRKQNDKKRDEGIYVHEQSLSQFYVNQIDSAAKHKEPFANGIIKATGKYLNGVTRTSDRWEDYVGAVLAKISQDIDDGTGELSGKHQEVNRIISELENDWSDYASAYALMEEYKLMSDAFVDEVSQTIAYSMFKGSKDTSQNEDYKLETHLADGDGRFMHPNAIRYMLIKTLELMKQHKEAIDNDKDSLKRYFENFEKNTFDDPESEDVIETAEHLKDRKVSFFRRWRKHPTGDQEDMKSAFRQYISKADSYRRECTQAYVLGEGIIYIESIIQAFESFYKSFESKVNLLDKNIDDIYKKYSESKGSTVKYVCASRTCLDKMYDHMPYTGNYMAIDSGLAKEIFEKVRDYALKPDKPNNNRYYSDLFDNGIIGYFNGSVMKNYGNDIDIDIITAIEKEADYLNDYEDEENAYDLIDQYVRKTIRDTRKLSCPFIESPLGESKEPIYACTFNKALKPDKGDESPRSNLIRKELMNSGGEPDEDIPKNMIMFYQSFYGLRANDLSKFAPPEKSMTYDRLGGEYFTAYYELIKGINPETHRSREISPHIDRQWHIITKMPDLDESNQKLQEYDIYAAFFWAVINGYVEQKDEGGIKIYKLNNIRLKMDDDTLVVSNGTDCDKLYEVLDAIAIYPELIDKILSKVDQITQYDLNSSFDLEKGFLFKSLNTFEIKEPGIGKENKSSKCIFDIPMLMKKSVTPDIYYEDNVIEMLEVIINEVKKYISYFIPEKKLPEVFGKIVIDQFEKHLESVALESEIQSTIYQESLFGKVSDTIITLLEDIGLRYEASELNDKVFELRNN